MRKLSWLITAFVLALCAGAASAQCTLAANVPLDSFQTIPGSIRQVNVIENSCPTGSLTSLAVSGGVITGVGTGFSFTVGKTLVISNVFDPGFGSAYPFDLVEGMPLTILTASSTGFTATYGRSAVSIGATTVTGTVQQISYVNWSTTTTTGTVTGTLSCTSACIPNTILTMDSTSGHCTASGTAVTSTQVLTVTATAVDTGSTASFPVYQCGLTTTVMIPGAGYVQAYKGQNIDVSAHVLGNRNRAITWTTTGGTLDSTTKRNTRFHATTQGRYTLTATSVADGTQSDSIIVYVASQSLPSYASSPPEKSEPAPCEVDATLTVPVLDIGPTQTFTTMNAALTTAPTTGFMMRLHNEDLTGTSPTTFAEYIQIGAIGSSAQPVIICGIPDSAGHYPVISGNGAHGPTYANTFLYGSGLITSFPSPSNHCSGNFPSSTCGAQHVLITGIKFIDANVGFSGFEADGTTPFNWGDGSDGVNIRVGKYFDVRGNHFFTDSQGVGTYDNGDNNGWVAITFAISIRRNYFDTLSASGSSTAHPVYAQSYVMDIDQNLINPPASGATDSCVKLRGISITSSANSCAPGYARYHDWGEVQDSASFLNGYDYITHNASAGDTLGLDVVAGYQEALQSDSVQYSNKFNSPSFFGNVIHFMADHDDNVGDYGMNARYGILNSFYETYAICGQVFDTSSGLSGENYFLSQRFLIEDDIFYCSPSGINMNSLANFTATMHTNLFNAGTIDNSLPIYGGHFNFADYAGWTNDSYFLPGIPFMMSPINPRLTTNFSTDWLTTSIAPFNTTTLNLVSGSAAIGAASTVTGENAMFFVGNNAVNLSGVASARANLTDLGATGFSTATLVSITVLPNPASVTTSGTVNMATSSFCTLSDSSTIAAGLAGCAVVWTDTNAHSSINSSTGIVTGATVGSDTVTATLAPATPGTATVNVSAGTPGGVSFGGHIKLSGSVKAQ